MKMNDSTQPGHRPLTAVLHRMQTEGLIRSYVHGQNELHWSLTDLGKTFKTLLDQEPEGASSPVSSIFDVGEVPIIGDVVSPDESGKLVLDIGPAIRSYLSDQAAPDYVEVGLLNHVVDLPHVLAEATPVCPQRIGMDIGINQTRPRSKITTAEFELVGCSVGFAGLFDVHGRLRCYGALVDRGDGQCAAPRWTVCPAAEPQSKEA